MAAVTSAVIAIAGVILGWITIEIACKPCLDKGRNAMDRSLNPDYDPDDENNNAVAARAPLIHRTTDSDPAGAISGPPLKSVAD